MARAEEDKSPDDISADLVYYIIIKIVTILESEDKDMMKLEELTEQQEQVYVDTLIAEGYETYVDQAELLNRLAISADYMLRYNNAPLDDEEKHNLETLRTLLPLCADLMLKCDSYYR